jgi:hypothetical protein
MGWTTYGYHLDKYTNTREQLNQKKAVFSVIMAPLSKKSGFKLLIREQCSFLSNLISL